MKSRTTRLFAGALVTLSSVVIFGQRDLRAQSPSGSIVGTICDASGVAVPEVSLRITNLQDNTARTIVSGSTGQYLVSGLAPGSYEVVAAKAGFSFPQLSAVTLNAGQQLRADFKVGAADPGLTPTVEQKLDAMERRIEQLEAELATKNTSDQAAITPARQPHGPLLASNSPATDLPALPGTVAIATNAIAAPDTPATPPAPPPDVVPHALSAPDAGPAVDNFTPFAFGDFTWLNGNSRDKDTVLDTKFFTPEVRFDTEYMQSFNQPVDHTIVGSTESFRSGEVQIEQASVGGDFHWDHVLGRILFMQGLFSTTTPRNDGSDVVGQWDLKDAYRYVSEAWGGYHFDALHGVNIEAGIFVSYIGLFSYYNFDNWTYQPSYVSSNTPWFFNGARAQIFVSNKLKIEPWFINGWQSYAKYNSHPGVGGQVLWMPKEWFKAVFNSYALGEDNVGLPNTQRIHEDDSIEVRYVNNPNSMGLSKAAFSLTADAGCQYGGGISCTGAPSQNKSSFVGWMIYDRYWFHKDLFAVTLGGGDMSNFGRYLTLLPPIDGATAQSGTPYFTENPGQKAHMWDSTINIQYMPKEYFTWWLEVGYRHSDIPYFAGREGVTPPGGDNLYPQYYTCTSGVSSMQGSLPAAQAACGGASDVWFPDLRRSQASASAGLLVRF
ncbi:MAG: TonB-dependent receptor [Bryobacteraceae bacterium]